MKIREQTIRSGKRGYLLLFAFLLLLTISSCAPQGDVEGAKKGFYHASLLYEKGEYDGAIAEYERILEHGMESGNIYYNLGNSYFKKGEIGKAILNYEKARQLIPRDKDLEANYAYARTLIKGDAPVVKRIWFLRVMDRIFSLFTVDGMTILLSALYIVIVSAIITAVCIRPFKRYAVAALMPLILLFAAASFYLNRRITLAGKETIIIMERVDARFEPFDRAETHFTLYEGMKVSIVSSKDDWYKIRRSDGKVGWVEKEDLGAF